MKIIKHKENKENAFQQAIAIYKKNQVRVTNKNTIYEI